MAKVDRVHPPDYNGAKDGQFVMGSDNSVWQWNERALRWFLFALGEQGIPSVLPSKFAITAAQLLELIGAKEVELQRAYQEIERLMKPKEGG